MNVRGQRVLIFGDSLSSRRSNCGDPRSTDQYNVIEGTNRAASAPGDLLASYLLAQGAAAVRVNARVCRSAWGFWQEDTSKLLQADAAWKPTMLVVMLGTNDIGLNLTKDGEALQRILDAYKRMGVSQVAAVGPPSFSIVRLHDGSPGVVRMLQKAIGAGAIVDARPLSADLLGPSYRTSDNVHFTAAGAAALAPRLAEALSKLDEPNQSAMSALKPIAWGFAGVLGVGLLTLGAFAIHRRQQRTLEGATVRPTSSTPSEPGYLYHATVVHRAHDIAQSGGVRTHRPNFGTEQDVWPDGSTEKRSYWTARAGVAHSFVPEDGEPALLRARDVDVGAKRERGTGDMVATKRVPAAKVEILTDEGWQPLTTWSRGLEGAAPRRKVKTLSLPKSPSATPSKIAKGECFEYAYGLAKKGGTLVHATVEHPYDHSTFPHAWVEKDGLVYDWQGQELRREAPMSVQQFYERWRPQDVRRYDDTETKIQALRHRHYGPWT